MTGGQEWPILETRTGRKPSRGQNSEPRTEADNTQNKDNKTGVVKIWNRKERT